MLLSFRGASEMSEPGIARRDFWIPGSSLRDAPEHDLGSTSSRLGREGALPAHAVRASALRRNPPRRRPAEFQFRRRRRMAHASSIRSPPQRFHLNKPEAGDKIAGHGKRTTAHAGLLSGIFYP